MKKRFRSIFGNSNPSLNTIDENTKPRPTSPAQSPVTNKYVPIKKKIVKSSSEQGFSRSNEERSQHADIKRRYKSLSDSQDVETDAGEQNFSSDNSSSTESLNNNDSQFDPKLAIIRSASVSFSSFPWLSRNNRASIARREANDIIEHMRQNISISSDGETDESETAPVHEQMTPPLQALSPWAFKAASSIPESHREGKLHAFHLLCKMTLQREHDIPLEREHLAQFYTVLHIALHSEDQVVVNKVIESCRHFFIHCLPASSLLLLDFLSACQTMSSLPDMQAPKVEAQTIVGSIIFLPTVYHNLTALDPNSADLALQTCESIKDQIVKTLLQASKNEPLAAARVAALANIGLWLYGELTLDQPHPRVKEAINVLLVSLKITNIAEAACFQLRLLRHCYDVMAKSLPGTTVRIVEVLIVTAASLLNQEPKKVEHHSKLIVCLLYAILEWSMSIPFDELCNSTCSKIKKPLLTAVFTVYQFAALGKESKAPTKTSMTLSELATLDFSAVSSPSKVRDASSGSANQSKPKTKPKKADSCSVVQSTANMAIKHLTNYLGHFPLARGTAVLASVVSENHDLCGGQDELSPSLFNSPEVQFLVFNDKCLLSMVDIPAEVKVPGGGPTAGMTTSDRCIRFIVRDVGGKYCWDSFILHGPPDAAEHMAPVTSKPASVVDNTLKSVAENVCQSYIDFANQHSKVKPVIKNFPLPNANLPCTNAHDKLDQLLQHLGASSPECQVQQGLPLNVPHPPPSCFSKNLEDDVIACIIRHHQTLTETVAKDCNASRERQQVMQCTKTAVVNSPFHYARLLCTELGFLSRDNRKKLHLLRKNERLLRELKNLDSTNCRETHKVAVFYIGEGQEDKHSILSNTAGSRAYEDFVAGLGWEVDLNKHCGFRGKLQSDGSTGTSCPYYATPTLEVIFHVSTRFPSASDTARNVKIRHLGNDEVHIVWSEHHRDYRRGIIPTEFGDVLIIIYPIRHGLYRIQIMKKQEIPYFGPLFDGAIVTANVLSVLVRETAVNAGRAKRSLINLYQTFYEERARYLEQITSNFKDEKTYEDYCAQLYMPAPLRKHSHPATSSVLPLNSTNENNGTFIPQTLSALGLDPNSVSSSPSETSGLARASPRKPRDATSAFGELASTATSNVDPTYFPTTKPKAYVQPTPKVVLGQGK